MSQSHLLYFLGRIQQVIHIYKIFYLLPLQKLVGESGMVCSFFLLLLSKIRSQRWTKFHTWEQSQCKEIKLLSGLLFVYLDVSHFPYSKKKKNHS